MPTLINSLVLLIFVGLTCSSFADDLQWNELIFTQEWGYAACRQFKDRPSDSETDKKCRFEDQPSIWSVHGIWPNKEGSIGPSFCKRVTFDVNALTPIISDLNQFWYEIDESKNAHHFWEHEWLKHGSCAMELNVFDSELKYFGEGINLRNKLDVYTILKSGGGIIPHPTEGYKLQDIHAAFQQALGTESAVPYAQCLGTKNQDTGVTEYHLLAIEICLDTNLQVIGCRKKVTKPGRNLQVMYGDQAEPCPPNEPILYTDYSFNRGSQIKSNHRMKPFFAKNLPMPNKFWKKFQQLRQSRNTLQ